MNHICVTNCLLEKWEFGSRKVKNLVSPGGTLRKICVFDIITRHSYFFCLLHFVKEWKNYQQRVTFLGNFFGDFSLFT